MDRESARLQLISSALQGILERDSSWLSKVVDDIFYKRLAHHCVSIADYILEEMENADTGRD